MTPKVKNAQNEGESTDRCVPRAVRAGCDGSDSIPVEDLRVFFNMSTRRGTREGKKGSCYATASATVTVGIRFSRSC